MNRAYKLANTHEAERLEEQSRNKNYSLNREFNLAGVEIENNDKILDAGCGTGLLSRALIDAFPNKKFNICAIDLTEELVTFAKEETKKSDRYMNRIEYQKMDICKTTYKDDFDKIFSRFVFQHIPSRQEQMIAAKALYSALSPGGSLFITDCYGFFSHLDTPNTWLLEQLSKVEANIPIDLNVGIKLRGLFLDIGVPLKDIKCFSENFVFDTFEERSAEANLWQQRFINAQSLLYKVLGEVGANRFSREYVKEIMNPRTFIHAQKFIVKISK